MAAIRRVTYVVLALGAVYTFGSMMSDARWNTGFLEWLVVAAFLAWAIAPYLALALLNALSKGSATITLISLVGAAAAVTFGVYVYVDIHRHLDAQGPLAYIFVPLYQMAWTALLFVPWIFIAARRRMINAGAAGPVKTGDRRSNPD